MRYGILLAAGLLVTSIGPARAEIALPTASFTGEGRLCTTGEGSDGKKDCEDYAIFYTPARWRLEGRSEKGRWVIIFDVDKRTKTTIDFSVKTYGSEPLDLRNDDTLMGFLPERADYVRAGEEVVNGVPTVKYKMSGNDERLGLKTEGFAWISADRIVHRLDAKVSGGLNFVIRFEATRLAVGPVDAKSLDVEIPSDFRKLLDR